MLSHRVRGVLPAVVAVAAVALFVVTPARSAILINASGPNNVGTTFHYLGNNNGVGFSLASDTNNVSVEVSVSTFGGSGDWNLVAFLTTQVGPGTTAASHEVASLSQTITIAGSSFLNPYTITPVTVFSGLNLLAGDYYLTLSGTFNTQNGFWVSSPTADATTSTSAGALVIAPYNSAGAPDPVYLPASLFTGAADYRLWFTVTGDPVESNVPEPGTAGIMLAGCVLLFGLQCGPVRAWLGGALFRR
ncbi:MAG: hypothetical protein U0R19_10665 [Bryobacteraceae bacterium]